MRSVFSIARASNARQRPSMPYSVQQQAQRIAPQPIAAVQPEFARQGRGISSGSGSRHAAQNNQRPWKRMSRRSPDSATVIVPIVPCEDWLMHNHV
ncbi:MAG: hypothetical protein ACLUHE_01800 [Christensenellales bacterium]